MDTLEITLTLDPIDPWTDIVTAELADLGCDSFVVTETGLIAYMNNDNYSDELLNQTSLVKEEVNYSAEMKVIPHQNWNADWESNFPPVYVDELASILAPFHVEADKKGIVAVIQPQMSFGTGHHQTTWMMTKALFQLGKMPESILDMGTGTGVLAIFAEKLGGKSILAIDIEDWSAVNARENADRNDCSNIETLCGDIDLVEGKQFGLILANINKNILKAHMSTYSDSLLSGGVLMLSGFFDSDVDEIEESANQVGLVKTQVLTREGWACAQFEKK